MTAGAEGHAEEQGTELSRRGFLKIGAAAAAGLAAEQAARWWYGKRHSKEVNEQIHNSADFSEYRPNLRSFQTGKLAGRKFSSLYSEYTGISGTVPAVAQIDFGSQLEKLWKKKERRAGNSRVVAQTGRELREEYRETNHHLTESGAYTGEIEATVAEVRNSLNWQALGVIKKLSPDGLILLKKTAEKITGKDLLAYSLTEIMPSAEGSLNVKVLDFLLQNAGKEYYESIPAVYDAKISFGPYQFTEFALYDTGQEKRGASIVNQALPKDKQIPGSVSLLRGSNHHKAAFLFMLDNVANLIRTLNPEEFKVFTEQLASNKNDVVAFAATAHHGPGWANKYAHKWLKDKARHHYREYCSSHAYKLYAQKTEVNLAALTGHH